LIENGRVPLSIAYAASMFAPIELPDVAKRALAAAGA